MLLNVICVFQYNIATLNTLDGGMCFQVMYYWDEAVLGRVTGVHHESTILGNNKTMKTF